MSTSCFAATVVGHRRGRRHRGAATVGHRGRNDHPRPPPRPRSQTAGLSLLPQHRRRSAARNCRWPRRSPSPTGPAIRGSSPGSKSSIDWSPPAVRCKICASRSPTAGMTVESAIGFAQWCVDDPAERKKGLEEARRIDGPGGRDRRPADRRSAGRGPRRRWIRPCLAERYAALLELGEQMGVVPVAEIWGPAVDDEPLGRSRPDRHRQRPPRCLHPARHLPSVQRGLGLQPAWACWAARRCRCCT